MAGLGFKDFQVGEVLTSADVDGYLMQQTVMVFPDAGARGSALGTAPGTAVALSDGMVAYLQDTDVVEVYDGSTWAPVSSRVVGMAGTATSAQTTGTTSIPVDNTIPQITEGVQFFTLTYTPVRSDTRLSVVAHVTCSEAANTSDQVTVALFQDSTADALDARMVSDLSGVINGIDDAFLLADVASTGAGTATTFQVRGGLNNTNSIVLNRTPASVNFAASLGDVTTSGMTVVEYLP